MSGEELAPVIARTFKDALDNAGIEHDFPRR